MTTNPTEQPYKNILYSHFIIRHVNPHNLVVCQALKNISKSGAQDFSTPKPTEVLNKNPFCYFQCLK